MSRPAEPTVYVFDFPDSRQTGVAFFKLGPAYAPDSFALRRWFNEYYGGSMNSLMFRTLREAKSLCYGVFASYNSPPRPEGDHDFTVFLTTQNDKAEQAIKGVLDLGFPVDAAMLEQAKQRVYDELTLQRFEGTALLDLAETYRIMHLPSDYRTRNLEQLEKTGIDELTGFYRDRIAGFDAMIIVGKIPPEEFLEKFGKVEKITFEDVFSD